MGPTKRRLRGGLWTDIRVRDADLIEYKRILEGLVLEIAIQT
jgi:hypothetical protein